MDDHSEDVMVALLPITTDWCKISLPHLTVVYAGDLKDLRATAFQELSKDVASIAMEFKPMTLKVMALDVFGDEEKVDVYRLRPSEELMNIRKMLIQWDASTYPIYSPHVTIGPMGSANPDPPYYLSFDRILLAYGDEKIVFWLKNN